MALPLPGYIAARDNAAPCRSLIVTGRLENSRRFTPRRASDTEARSELYDDTGCCYAMSGTDDEQQRFRLFAEIIDGMLRSSRTRHCSAQPCQACRPPQLRSMKFPAIFPALVMLHPSRFRAQYAPEHRLYLPPQMHIFAAALRYYLSPAIFRA